MSDSTVLLGITHLIIFQSAIKFIKSFIFFIKLIENIFLWIQVHRLYNLFNKIKETEISDKPAIVTTEENLITVINENFVNEKGMPLMGHETGKSYDKIKVNCDIKAITEVFAYLSLASNHPNDKTLYYLRGRESSVKRIIANCFQHSFQEDNIRKYINDFYDSAESIGLNDHVNAIRKQRRKQNLISVVIDALSS